MRVTTVGAHGEHIADDQQGQQHTGRLPGRKHGGEDREADGIGAADGGLREADEYGCRRERGELPEGNGVHATE
ncbi:hypothetical protein GCM10009579_47360 [Streptomyces javensis]|uniref:Uncharacterized protein n=1 Tax=Streptomyces javensis TaxID=114698 RepID=A0ABP4HQT1_9ACTN